MGLPAQVPLKTLGTHLPWLELRSLWLRGFILLEDELVDFVVNHRPALSRILFTDCPLKTGSWSSSHNGVKSLFPGNFHKSNKHTSSAILCVFSLTDAHSHFDPFLSHTHVDTQILLCSTLIYAKRPASPVRSDRIHQDFISDSIMGTGRQEGFLFSFELR